MAELDRRISGDWYEIREKLRQIDDLVEYLWPEDQDIPVSYLKKAVHQLEQSVELGVVEYKRGSLARLFVDLEDAGYSSEIFHHLKALQAQVEVVILAAAVQRGLLAREIRHKLNSQDVEQSAAEDAAGQNDQESTGNEPGGGDGLHVSSPAETAQETARPDQTDNPADAKIRSIIDDIQTIVASDPQARMNSWIKNILLQLNKYRDEMATFKKLKQQTAPERMEGLARNFHTSFEKIFDSIRKNYAAYLQEQEQKRKESKLHLFQRVEPKQYVRHLIEQLEQLSRMRSTLIHIRTEQYGMREPLVRLAQKRDEFMNALDTEMQIADTATGEEATAAQLVRLLGLEIAGYLRRMINTPSEDTEEPAY